MDASAARDQLGDDGRIGLDRGGVPAPSSAPGGRSSGSGGTKSSRSRTVCSASPVSGSDLPESVQDAGAAGGRGQRWVTSTNSRPPASAIGARRRHLPERQPERLHGVGHHLLVADGDVDVVLRVAGRGDREQRGDRPALDDLELVVDQAPLDVLRAAEVRLDPPAELREPHDLRIGQRRLLLPLRLDRLLLRPARRRARGWRAAWRRSSWRRPRRRAPGRRPGSPGRRPAPRRGRSRPRWRRPSGSPVTGSAVNRMPAASREHHPLHDDGHVDRAVVDAVAQAIGHGPLGEQRRPAPADVLEDRRRPHDVQVGVLLAGEGGRRQVLRRRAGPDGVGGLLAERGERARDRRCEVVGDGDPLDGPADLRAERPDRRPVVGLRAATAGRADPRSTGAPPRRAGRRRSSRRSRPARGCRRSATAHRGARPCRRRPSTCVRSSASRSTTSRVTDHLPSHRRVPTRLPKDAIGRSSRDA